MAQCTILPTRKCPKSYGDEGCGDRLCARFESDDETPWLPEICLGRNMDCGRSLPCPDHPSAEAIARGGYNPASVHACDVSPTGEHER
jgi:hypothetical protein